MTDVEHIIWLGEAYCAATLRSEARIATIIFNDGKKFDLLRSGRDVGTRTYRRAVEWFSQNWPSDLEWPDAVERPVRSVADEAC